MRFNLFLPSSGKHRILSLPGPTWQASPVRRIVQSVCLVGFLAFLFYVCWPYGSRDYAAQMHAKELIDAEAFLALDPLLSISTAIAARAWEHPIAMM